jgi:hypothetical protein
MLFCGILKAENNRDILIFILLRIILSIARMNCIIDAAAFQRGLA